jgi:hypothetical protein
MHPRKDGCDLISSEAVRIPGARQATKLVAHQLADGRDSHWQRASINLIKVLWEIKQHLLRVRSVSCKLNLARRCSAKSDQMMTAARYKGCDLYGLNPQRHYISAPRQCLQPSAPHRCDTREPLCRALSG